MCRVIRRGHCVGLFEGDIVQGYSRGYCVGLFEGDIVQGYSKGTLCRVIRRGYSAGHHTEDKLREEKTSKQRKREESRREQNGREKRILRGEIQISKEVKDVEKEEDESGFTEFVHLFLHCHCCSCERFQRLRISAAIHGLVRERGRREEREGELGREGG